MAHGSDGDTGMDDGTTDSNGRSFNAAMEVNETKDSGLAIRRGADAVSRIITREVLI